MFKDGSFLDTESDILEKTHFADAEKVTDYEMIVPVDYEPVSATILQVVPIETEERQRLDELASRDAMFNMIGGDLEEEAAQLRQTEYALESVEAEQTALQILGVDEDGDLVFSYVNMAQSINSTFGVTLREYDGLDIDTPEGVYTFKTAANKDAPGKYSEFDADNVVS